MSKKSRALKALLVLAVFIALCMYFSRTVQTITTPKVTLTQAQTGRLESELTLNASAYFPAQSEVTLTQAAKYPITVEKVYVKPGHYVKAGETLFTASLTDYQKQLDDLTSQYNEKSKALTDLDIANRKSSKQSMQNDLYATMNEKQEAQTKAENAARIAASEKGITLSFDSTTWEAEAMRKGAEESVLSLIRDAAAAKQSSDDAREAFFNSYENKQIKVKDEVFKYINDRNQLIKEMGELSDQLVKLLAAHQQLSNVTAPEEGYIVAVNVAKGDAYDGRAVAYALAKKDDAPVLRADLAGVKKEVNEGAKVEIKDDWRTAKTKVTGIETGTDGHKYAIIELTDDALNAAGGMSQLLSNGSIEVKMTFRAKKSATLLPASCIRSEGEGAEYVYTVERSYGGFLQSGKMTARKQSITIIDRADKVVSVEEDFGYNAIIDTADRTITDGKPVMEQGD